MKFADLDNLAGAQTREALLTDIVERVAPRRMAEIGVWEGDLASRLLDEFADIAVYYMIDPWRTLQDWDKPFNVSQTAFDIVYEKACARTERHAARRRILRGRTLEAIGEIPDGFLDIAYIDGDHTLRGVTTDLQAAWPKIRPGGWIIGDDFSPTIWQHDRAYEPTLVFPYAIYFAEAVGAPIAAIDHNQFAMMKPERGRNFIWRDLTGAYPPPGLKGQMAPETPLRERLWKKISAA